MNQTAANTSLETDHQDINAEAVNDFLTIRIENQLFGVPVLQVQDVLGSQKVTNIPLAPPEIAGVLNLRGRIVTAIDVRKRLGLSERDDNKENMSVVVEHEDELYSLIIDQVGDVLNMAEEEYETTPATLDPVWRDVSQGIFRLEEELLVILDVSKLLNTVHA